MHLRWIARRSRVSPTSSTPKPTRCSSPFQSIRMLRTKRGLHFIKTRPPSMWLARPSRSHWTSSTKNRLSWRTPSTETASWLSTWDQSNVERKTTATLRGFSLTCQLELKAGMKCTASWKSKSRLTVGTLDKYQSQQTATSPSLTALAHRSSQWRWQARFASTNKMISVQNQKNTSPLGLDVLMSIKRTTTRPSSPPWSTQRECRAFIDLR